MMLIESEPYLFGHCQGSPVKKSPGHNSESSNPNSGPLPGLSHGFKKYTRIFVHKSLTNCSLVVLEKPPIQTPISYFHYFLFILQRKLYGPSFEQN